MSARATLLAIVASMVVSATAYAQFDVNPGARRQRSGPGRLQASGFVGMLTIDQSLGTSENIYQTVTGEAQNIDFGRFYGLRASWGFTDELAVEFNLAAGNNAYTLSVEDEEAGDAALGEQFDASRLILSGNLVYQFDLGNIVPYVTGGAGLLRVTPKNRIEGFERVSTLDINFGGGAKFWLNSPQWLGFRVDFRYHIANDGLTFPGGTSSPKGFELTAGAGFRLF